MRATEFMHFIIESTKLTATDRIAYWNMFDFPKTIPLYGIVIESWWIDQEKVKKLNR